MCHNLGLAVLLSLGQLGDIHGGQGFFSPTALSLSLFGAYGLRELFFVEDELDDANVHIEQSKWHATDNPYNLGRAMEGQGTVWYRQGRLRDAKSEASHAVEVFEKLGAAKDAVECSDFFQLIEESTESCL